MRNDISFEVETNGPKENAVSWDVKLVCYIGPRIRVLISRKTVTTKEKHKEVVHHFNMIARSINGHIESSQ